MLRTNIHIKIKNMKHLIKFNILANKFDYNFVLITENSFFLNPKSLMNLFIIDFKKNIEIGIKCEDSNIWTDFCLKFKEYFKDFIIT